MQLSQLILNLNRKKIFNEHFNLCKGEIYLDEIKKSINSETNNNYLGNDSLATEFHEHFSNNLSPFLLDVYDSLKAWHHGCYF